MARPLRGQIVNLVLALVAVALVVVVVMTSRRVTTGEREARERNVLSAFREKDITRLTLERGSRRLVVQRERAGDAGDASWRLIEPTEEEAEAYAMDKLLGSLEFATWVRRIEPAQVDRAGFGLDQPSWVLGIEMGEIRYELRLGKEAATPKGAHYLELVARGAPGSGVGVISRDLATELGVDPSELRGRQIMPYLSDALRALTLEGQGGSRRLTSLGEKRWRFDGMLGGVRVDRETFDAVLLQFARTKAEHFLEVPAAEQALLAAGAESVRVTMVPKRPERATGIVVVGGRCPSGENAVVALRKQPEPVAACVPRSVMPGLITPAEALIDRSLFSLRSDELESLVIVRGDQKLELERKQDGFVMRAPVKADVDLDTGNQHLEAIVRARGTIVEKPDLAKLGLDPLQGRVTVKAVAEDDSKVLEETIQIGRAEASGALAVRRAADGAVLELDPQTAHLLTADASLLRKRRLLDFAPSALLSVESESKALHQRIRREPSGAFTLELPKGAAHDAALATALVDVLGSLEADRWVAARDDGSFGLGEPALRARIVLEQADGGAREHTLLIGAATSGGQFAKLETSPPLPGVFVLPRRTVETLETPLLDRSVFMVAPDAAARIVLVRPTGKLTLEKRGDSWSAAGLSPARIAELTEALASLRAESAIRLGAARPGEGFARPELEVRVEPPPGPGAEKPWTFRIGAGDAWQGTSIHYARRDGVDATYAIAKSKVRAILDAL
jgi:hypothetical protein